MIEKVLARSERERRFFGEILRKAKKVGVDNRQGVLIKAMTTTASLAASVDPILGSAVDVRARRSDTITFECTAHPCLHDQRCDKISMKNEQVRLERIYILERLFRLVKPSKHALVCETIHLQFDVARE